MHFRKLIVILLYFYEMLYEYEFLLIKSIIEIK